MSIRLWFAGTPAFAAHNLQTLIDSGDYTIDGVLTQPDRPAGRGRKLTASAVKQTALTHAIPVAQPKKLHADAPPFPDLPRPDLIIVARLRPALAAVVSRLPAPRLPQHPRLALAALARRCPHPARDRSGRP